MKTDTPRTDEATLRAIDIEGGGEFQAVHIQVSKQLERELNAARAEIEGLNFALKQASSIYDAVTEQRDEQREIYGKLYSAELTRSNHYKQQRDRLAEALEHSMKHMRHSLNCPARITKELHPCNCQMDWAYDNATEALQSLT